MKCTQHQLRMELEHSTSLQAVQHHTMPPHTKCSTDGGPNERNTAAAMVLTELRASGIPLPILHQVQILLQQYQAVVYARSGVATTKSRVACMPL